MKATLHWVSAAHAVDAEVRLYDRLFNVEEPGKVGDYHDRSEPGFARGHAARQGRAVGRGARRRARGSSSSASATSASTPIRTPARPVFNRTVTLKDSLGERSRGEGLRAKG